MQTCPRCGNVEKDGVKECSRCHVPLKMRAASGQRTAQRSNGGGTRPAPQRPAGNTGRTRPAPQRPAGNSTRQAGNVQKPTGVIKNAGGAQSKPGKKVPQGVKKAEPKQNNVARNNQNVDETPAEFMSVKDCIVMLLILAIPIVNIVKAVGWIKDSWEKPNRANLAKAYMIYWGISMGLSIVIGLVIGMM